MSPMFSLLYPNFKRPIPSQKWILKQQVPLNIPKHSTKITCQCTSPFRHLVKATPKTMRKPFRGHGRRCRPRPPWPQQRSAARPRQRGLREPPTAAPSSLGRQGCDAEGGAAATAVEKQGVAMGCFSGSLGKILNIGHKYSKYLTALLSKFVPYSDAISRTDVGSSSRSC